MGTVIAVQLYELYGQINYACGSIPTSHNYTGQRLDSQSGLLSYQFRWYDPFSGQFTRTATKQTNAQGFNPYAYVSDNPETKNDPTGHWGWGAILAVVAVVVVVAVVAVVAAPVVIAAAGAAAEVAADGAVAGAVAEEPSMRRLPVVRLPLRQEEKRRQQQEEKQPRRQEARLPQLVARLLPMPARTRQRIPRLMPRQKLDQRINWIQWKMKLRKICIVVAIAPLPDTITCALERSVFQIRMTLIRSIQIIRMILIIVHSCSQAKHQQMACRIRVRLKHQKGGGDYPAAVVFLKGCVM